MVIDPLRLRLVTTFTLASPRLNVSERQRFSGILAAADAGNDDLHHLHGFGERYRRLARAQVADKRLQLGLKA